MKITKRAGLKFRLHSLRHTHTVPGLQEAAAKTFDDTLNLPSSRSIVNPAP